METFILGWEKTRALHIPNVQEMTPAHHKGMTKELESMVFRSASRKDTLPHLSMAFLLPFENKVILQLNVLIKELSETFNGVMQSVVKNQLFNTGFLKLFWKGMKRNPQRERKERTRR